VRDLELLRARGVRIGWERHSIDGRRQFDGLTTSMRWPLQTGFACFRSTGHH